jgi:hypothetical protein
LIGRAGLRVIPVLNPAMSMHRDVDAVTIINLLHMLPSPNVSADRPGIHIQCVEGEHNRYNNHDKGSANGYVIIHEDRSSNSNSNSVKSTF